MEKLFNHKEITITIILYKEDYNLINKTLSKLILFNTLFSKYTEVLSTKKKPF